MSFCKNLFTAALAAFAFVFSATAAIAADQTYVVRGIVEKPYSEGTITIRHGDIPGLMPAMTMPFNVDEADVKYLVPGDVVEFEFMVGETSKATKFRKLGDPSGARPQARQADGASTARKRLKPGDPVPPFALIDQNGRALSEADLKGQLTVLTFVFTRCPVPEFCPLLGKKFKTLQEQLPAESKAQLLSISIDPAFDTPPVLREYGRSLGADFSKWRFATGTMEQVTALQRAFAVHVERREATLDHTLATALVGADGKVLEVWRGNAWKTDDVLAAVRAATSK